MVIYNNINYYRNTCIQQSIKTTIKITYVIFNSSLYYTYIIHTILLVKFILNSYF